MHNQLIKNSQYMHNTIVLYTFCADQLHIVYSLQFEMISSPLNERAAVLNANFLQDADRIAAANTLFLSCIL